MGRGAGPLWRAAGLGPETDWRFDWAYCFCAAAATPSTNCRRGLGVCGVACCGGVLAANRARVHDTGVQPFNRGINVDIAHHSIGTLVSSRVLHRQPWIGVIESDE